MRFKTLLFQLFFISICYTQDQDRKLVRLKADLISDYESNKTDDEKSIIILRDLTEFLALEETEFEDFDFYNNKLIAIAERTNNYKALARAYMHKGFALRDVNRNLTLEYFNKALDVHQYFDNPEEKGWLYMYIGGLYDVKGMHDKAIEYLEKSLDILEPINYERLSLVYYNYACPLGNLGKYEKALEYLEKAIKDPRITDRIKFFSEIYYWELKYLLGDYEIAISGLKSCIEKEKKVFTTEPVSVLRAKGLISKSYLELNKTKEAFDVISSIDLNDVKKEGLAGVSALVMMIEVYLSLERYDKAFQCMEIKEQVKDKYQSTEREKEFDKLNLLYETKEKELALAKEKQEKLEINQKLKQSKITSIFLLIVSLLGLIILLITLWYLRVTKRQTKTIEAQKEQVELAYSEYVILTKELNHRVKNNLQIISSVIFLSYSEVKDESFVNILKKINSRIKSIALLHQELSLGHELGTVNMNHYLNKVSNIIHDSYEKPNKKINLIVEIPQVQINTNDAVTIGMLLNELISNSYKYAFSKNYIDEKLSIKITHVSHDFYKLMYNDGGTFGNEANNKKTSLGSSLILFFAKKLEGTIDYIHNQSSRTFTLTFRVK